MKQLDGSRLSTVFATDADLEMRIHRTPRSRSHFDELAYSLLVEHAEWIFLINPLPDIMRKKGAGIISAESQRHLG